MLTQTTLPHPNLIYFDTHGKDQAERLADAFLRPLRWYIGRKATLSYNRKANLLKQASLAHRIALALLIVPAALIALVGLAILPISKTHFATYWTAEATAAYKSKDIARANDLCLKVLARKPDHPPALELQRYCQSPRRNAFSQNDVSDEDFIKNISIPQEVYPATIQAFEYRIEERLGNVIRRIKNGNFPYKDHMWDQIRRFINTAEWYEGFPLNPNSAARQRCKALVAKGMPKPEIQTIYPVWQLCDRLPHDYTRDIDWLGCQGGGLLGWSDHICNCFIRIIQTKTHDLSDWRKFAKIVDNIEFLRLDFDYEVIKDSEKRFEMKALLREAYLKTVKHFSKDAYENIFGKEDPWIRIQRPLPQQLLYIRPITNGGPATPPPPPPRRNVFGWRDIFDGNFIKSIHIPPVVSSQAIENFENEIEERLRRFIDGIVNSNFSYSQECWNQICRFINTAEWYHHFPLNPNSAARQRCKALVAKGMPKPKLQRYTTYESLFRFYAIPCLGKHCMILIGVIALVMG